MGFFDFFSTKKSSNKNQEENKGSFLSNIGKSIIGKNIVDEEILDKIEDELILSDVGVETTIKIINELENKVKHDKYIGIKEIYSSLKNLIVQLMSESCNKAVPLIPDTAGLPYVVLVIGVNGVGKTTTIGKLANFFKEQGKSVILGAADTFRAAAVDQINLWGEKVGVPVVTHGMNTDPSSVAYDTVKKAVEENYDVVLIDTAGRLHNKVTLMNELAKIKRVIQKFIPEAPQDTMIVLDGNTGQNAFVQVREFNQVTDISCITITKLDGTAKGGVIVGIAAEFGFPIKYIGLGEKVSDIKVFNYNKFIDRLFETT